MTTDTFGFRGLVTQTDIQEAVEKIDPTAECTFYNTNFVNVICSPGLVERIYTMLKEQTVIGIGYTVQERHKGYVKQPKPKKENRVFKWIKSLRALDWGFAAFVVLVLSLTALSKYRDYARDQLPRKQYDQLIGTVTQVSGCSTGKHSLRCWVRFSAGQLIYTDVTDWPGNNVQVGQVVHFRTIQKGDNWQEFYYVVEGQKFMRYHSHCNDPAKECWRTIH